LLKHFGNIEAIAKAEKAELLLVDGINESLADTIRDYFG
jgi:excinuclease UvrABC nuclease subunit